MRRSGVCIAKIFIAATFALFVFLVLSYLMPDPIVKSIPFREIRRANEYHQQPLPFESNNNIANNQKPRWLDESNNEKIDWHDEISITRDLLREGLGEQGLAAHLDKTDKAKEKKLYSENGFNAYLSDHISLNRSVPDIRHPGCKTKKYLKNLPVASVVIPFYNEHWSTLLRSCYSILNRSPPQLIKEIILVDDESSKEFLKDKLQMYVEKFVPKTRIVRLPERSGLIVARLAGAREATGDVLIFLDSHIEANYNWLPPLLEPIAENPKTCVCPFIDVIDYNTFNYRTQDEGARGAFDWEFYYKRLPLLPEDLKDKTKPFRSPIMAGGLFAINREFFWELGGYDEGLDIWGGEQYELSFKIWMCGGEMVDAPCSRVGHIYRGAGGAFRNPRKTDYLHRNYKRVAEVWMDEYKKYLYDRNPDRYNNIDAGDLQKQKEIRERLKCKSFKWFMEEIAFDLPKKYPPVEPPDYAHGVIRSVDSPHLCLDSMNNKRNQEVGMFQCATNSIRPHGNQNWALSWHKDLRLFGKLDCLDVSKSTKSAPVTLYECHGQQGNQLWYYDTEQKWLVHGKNSRCLEIDAAKKKVYVNKCDPDNKKMKWTFGFVNNTALNSFHDTEVKDML